MSVWKQLMAVSCMIVGSAVTTVDYAKADAAMDADIQKWHDTPAQELSPKMRAFVEKSLKERGEPTDLKATMEKIRSFPNSSVTVICGIAGDQVFSMILTFYKGDSSKNDATLYMNGSNNRIARICNSYGF